MAFRGGVESLAVIAGARDGAGVPMQRVDGVGIRRLSLSCRLSRRWRAMTISTRMTGAAAKSGSRLRAVGRSPASLLGGGTDPGLPSARLAEGSASAPTEGRPVEEFLAGGDNGKTNRSIKASRRWRGGSAACAVAAIVEGVKDQPEVVTGFGSRQRRSERCGADAELDSFVSSVPGRPVSEPSGGSPIRSAAERL